MRRISIIVLLAVFLLSASAQNTNNACNPEIESMSGDQVINEAPPDWNFDCLNKRIITEVINNDQHVKGIVDCLQPDEPICTKEGYRVIAEEIFRRSDASGRCPSCSPRTVALVDFGLKLLQKRQPRELRRGLGYLG